MAVSEEPFAPGWKADPDDPRREQWWDGVQWSDERRARPDADGRTGFPLATHPGARHPVHAGVLPARGRSPHSRWSTALALSPMWAGVVAGASAPFIEGSDAPARDIVVVAAVVWLACSVLALLDRDILLDHGYEPVPPLMSVLAGPVYLALRQRSRDDRGRALIEFAVSIPIGAAATWLLEWAGERRERQLWRFMDFWCALSGVSC